jgi:hypothetical protein
MGEKWQFHLGSETVIRESSPTFHFVIRRGKKGHRRMEILPRTKSAHYELTLLVADSKRILY